MSDKPLPAVPYLKIPENGEPYLEAYKCGQCGATFLGDALGRKDADGNAYLSYFFQPADSA